MAIHASDLLEADVFCISLHWALGFDHSNLTKALVSSKKACKFLLLILLIIVS